MWLKRFTNFLLRNRLLAVLLTFVTTFIPVIGIVGIMFAAMVTLVRGAAEGAVFALAATLPYVISFAFTGTNQPMIPLVVWAAVGVAVTSNILTWGFAMMLRKQTSWSSILQMAALLGVLIVSVIHLVYPDVVTWWGEQLQSYYNQIQPYYDQAATSSLKNRALTPSEMQIATAATINVTKQYATGLMVCAILFNSIIQLIVARWWQAAVFNPGILRKELRSIRLTQLAGALFIASIVISYWGNSVISDIMPILYMLFGAAGLSLIHYLFGLMKSPAAWFWLSVFYMAFFISLPVSLMLVALFALADIWLDVRKRVKKL